MRYDMIDVVAVGGKRRRDDRKREIVQVCSNAHPRRSKEILSRFITFDVGTSQFEGEATSEGRILNIFGYYRLLSGFFLWESWSQSPPGSSPGLSSIPSRLTQLSSHPSSSPSSPSSPPSIWFLPWVPHLWTDGGHPFSASRFDQSDFSVDSWCLVLPSRFLCHTAIVIVRGTVSPSCAPEFYFIVCFNASLIFQEFLFRRWRSPQCSCLLWWGQYRLCVARCFRCAMAVGSCG